MNSDNSSAPSESTDRANRLSVLFLNMIAQQTNLALVFLGKVPHPETGTETQDLESARMMIDQLEMMEAKTKGNLNQREDALLKQSLMSLRMMFVEAFNQSEKSKTAEPSQSTPAAPQPDQETPSEPGIATATDTPQKKFSKKY